MKFDFETTDYQLKAEPLTVGELKKKIHNLPADTPVFMVFDKTSEYAWHEDHDRWRYAVPVAYATRERNDVDDGFEGFRESVLLLEIENP